MSNKNMVTESFFRLWGHMETLQGQHICDSTIDVVKYASANGRGTYATIGRITTDSDGYYDVVLPVQEGVEYMLAVDAKQEDHYQQQIIEEKLPAREIVANNRDTFCENIIPVDFENYPYMQI